MYACIFWVSEDDSYITFAHNENGSMKIFKTIEQADTYANKLDPNGENIRVVSINGIMD